MRKGKRIDWHQIRIQISALLLTVNFGKLFICLRFGQIRGSDWISDRKYISLIEHTLLEGFGEKASEGRAWFRGKLHLND